MKKIIIGSIFIILGLFGLSVFSSALFTMIAGILPLVLIIGGGVTVFLNLNSDAFGETAATDAKPVIRDKLEPAQSPAVPGGPAPVATAEPVMAVESEPEPAPEAVFESAPEPETAPEIAPAPEAVPVSEPEPEPGAAEAPGTEQFFGNTGSMVFHSAACKYAANKNCTAVFSTRDKAFQAGYKPCKVCCGE